MSVYAILMMQSLFVGDSSRLSEEASITRDLFKLLSMDIGVAKDIEIRTSTFALCMAQKLSHLPRVREDNGAFLVPTSGFRGSPCVESCDMILGLHPEEFLLPWVSRIIANPAPCSSSGLSGRLSP
ncbi:hypothetical protein PV11_03770 [Exophiala sideris]|uniref:Uncharacterized protein n=1 Tax=Exophiala sideris TaxID=1016849 RepID=A0A0D1YFC0_9EURO|nr:hypothetical protein PV11_03770 [Exophiala sideris]